MFYRKFLLRYLVDFIASLNTWTLSGTLQVVCSVKFRPFSTLHNVYEPHSERLIIPSMTDIQTSATQVVTGVTCSIRPKA